MVKKLTRCIDDSSDCSDDGDDGDNNGNGNNNDNDNAKEEKIKKKGVFYDYFNDSNIFIDDVPYTTNVFMIIIIERIVILKRNNRCFCS